MALKRELLKGMGLTEEQVSAIITEHAASIDGIKAQYDTRIGALEAEIEAAKANAAQQAEKYTALNTEYEGYKTEVNTKEANRAKGNAYRTMLRDIGIADKRLDSIMRVTDLNGIELDKDGNIKDADKLTAKAREEWADMIVVAPTVGAATATPPANNGGSTMSKKDILDIRDPVKRQKAIAENIELFTKG